MLHRRHHAHTLLQVLACTLFAAEMPAADPSHRLHAWWCVHGLSCLSSNLHPESDSLTGQRVHLQPHLHCICLLPLSARASPRRRRQPRHHRSCACRASRADVRPALGRPPARSDFELAGLAVAQVVQLGAPRLHALLLHHPQLLHGRAEPARRAARRSHACCSSPGRSGDTQGR